MKRTAKANQTMSSFGTPARKNKKKETKKETAKQAKPKATEDDDDGESS